jgi:hypothetical protein
MEEGPGTINGAQQQFVSHGIHSEEYSCTRAVSIMSREMARAVTCCPHMWGVRLHQTLVLWASRYSLFLPSPGRSHPLNA